MAKLKIPKTVTYRGRRYKVIGRYLNSEIATKVADEMGGKAVWLSRYDPAYLVIRK